MKSPWLLLLLLALVYSCAHRPAPQNAPSAKELPAWVYAPMDECVEARELCASGEGQTGAQASANALKALGAIFETKVTGSTTSTMTVRGSAVLAEAQETAWVAVRDEVAQTLEAARISRQTRHKNMSYALASLDKAKASQNLRERMDTLQAELAGLWQRKDRTGWARMWQLFHQREGLNDRYAIVTGQRASYAPSAQELQAWYQSRRAEIPLALDHEAVPAELLAALKSRLTNAGYRLFDFKTGARLELRFAAAQEHLNVKDFEKWNFAFTLTHLSKNGAKVGVVDLRETVTGRSRVDCEARAREALVAQLEKRLSELNLQD